ncbi:MAG: hypothetical protein GY950_15690 [bacterium]|nr:hypothetical protein [bacterium]
MENIQKQYFYYNSYGKRVYTQDPGSVLVVVFPGGSQKSKIRDEVEKLEMKIVKEGRVSERSNLEFFLLEGRNHTLNRYREEKLAILKKLNGVNSAGFLLDSSARMDPYAFYTGVVTIEFPGKETENRLGEELEKEGLIVQTCKYIGAMSYLMVECPPEAGTKLIDEYLEKIKKMEHVNEVAPELFGVTQ